MVKVDRFGLIKRAMHGTRRLSIRETHSVYGRQLVDLRESRWLFLNTLFSVSEGCLYAQLVELLDTGELNITDQSGEPLPTLTYEQLFNAVSKALFKAHVEGRLKADVMNDPERYVELDNELPLALLDQREAGKKLALITNSDWQYTKTMMSQVMDRFLPKGLTWRHLFDVIIVSSRKPAFFSQTMPLYEIVTEDGMMREKFRMKEGRIYSGGNAGMVEKLFNCDSDDVMYVGDHIFTDVNIAKAYMRWRTALIVREVEEEVIAIDRGRQATQELSDLVKAKEQCANILNHLRTELHRYRSLSLSLSLSLSIYIYIYIYIYI
jgi:HAD superfamily 5'-nucleotidase-like hydrolase